MNPLHHPSLELQIKLKKIGFTNCETVTDTCGNYIRHTPGFDIGEYNPCPNVMEMLDVMPKSLFTMYMLTMGEKFVAYDDTTLDDDGCSYIGKSCAMVCSDSLPNAMAIMILDLHNNKHLSFDK